MSKAIIVIKKGLKQVGTGSIEGEFTAEDFFYIERALNSKSHGLLFYVDIVEHESVTELPIAKAVLLLNTATPIRCPNVSSPEFNNLVASLKEKGIKDPILSNEPPRATIFLTAFLGLWRHCSPTSHMSHVR